MKKGSKLVVCEPRDIVLSTHDFTLNELRLLESLQASIDMKEGVLPGKVYRLGIQEYADTYGMSYELACYELKDAVASILHKSIKFKSSIFEEGKKGFTLVNWFHKIEYGDGSGYISVVWHEYICAIFSQLGTRYLYDRRYLEETAPFKSVHSKRLYRLLLATTYRRGKTIKDTVEWEVEELKGHLGLLQEEYKAFRDFNLHVVKLAVKEINQLSKMKVEVDYNTRGRKVVGICMKIEGELKEEDISIAA